MGDDLDLATVLRTLYSAPLRPELWALFLRELAVAIGVNKAVLIEHNVAKNEHKILALTGGELQESVKTYEAHYYQHDCWTLNFPRDAPSTGRLVLGEEIWPRASFQHSVFYNEFLKDFDISEMACIAADNGESGFDALSIFRGHSEVLLRSCRLDILRAIAPHLKVALASRRRFCELEKKTSTFENALRQLRSPIFLVDRLGKVIFANTAAEEILRRGLLRVWNGRLMAHSSTDSVRLQHLVERATQTASRTGAQTGGEMAVLQREKAPIYLFVSPFPRSSSSFDNAAAAIHVSNPHETQTTATVLRSLFRLTPAEASVAVGIAAGDTLGEIARRNHVSRETIKSQVRSIYQKTGTGRQTELVRLITKLQPVSRADD